MNIHGRAFEMQQGLEILKCTLISTNLGDTVRVHAVEGSDIPDSVQRDTHGNLQLDCRDVAARHHLSSWVLDLKTRVELEEVERVV